MKAKGLCFRRPTKKHAAGGGGGGVALAIV